MNYFYFYFWLFKFFFDLISQKDHFMVSQKIHQSNWMCSNWPNVKMINLWFNFSIKLTMISYSGWCCTSHILVFNSYVFIFESHNLILFLIWNLNLNISFILCSYDSLYFWQMSSQDIKTSKKTLFLICLLIIYFYFVCFMGHTCVIANHNVSYNDKNKKSIRCTITNDAK